MKNPRALLCIVASILLLNGCSINTSKESNPQHPRIYCSNDSKAALIESFSNVEWKKELIEKKKENLEKYILLCEEDSSWLLSRLQMNWETMHSEVYLKGGDFSHSDGQAPVPTVRFSGTRDWATDFRSPAIEDIEPYFDDSRGMFFENKHTSEKEWVHPSEVGHGIETINRQIMSLIADAAFLYWYTGEEKYAEFAAPVFFSYIDGMHYRNPPTVIDNSSQHGISGLATFEVIHEQIVIQLCLAYDFLFDYFQ
ncbi:MAG: six-hairpin glycosidase, partial [Bacteroides sp.]|nr:six-hairpin glycosidase [Bacteroides sp.]